jgi:hypothetical protein
MTPERKRQSAFRRAKNEAIFRENNERIKRRAEVVLPEENKPNFEIGFVCECSDETCHQTVRLTLEQFDRWSKNRKHFILRPDHHQSDIERIVGTEAGFVVAEKFQPPPPASGELEPTASGSA